MSVAPCALRGERKEESAPGDYASGHEGKRFTPCNVRGTNCTRMMSVISGLLDLASRSSSGCKDSIL